MIIGGGWGGVLTSLTSTSFTLRKMQTFAHAVSCVKDYPHKRFKLAQVNHKQNIITKTKTYHFRGRLWDKSYRTIAAGTQQMDGTWKHFKKRRPPSMLHKKKTNVYKKRYTWAYSWTWRHNAALLQTVASALPQALWHRQRREEEKTGRVNVALI